MTCSPQRSVGLVVGAGSAYCGGVVCPRGRRPGRGVAERSSAGPQDVGSQSERPTSRCGQLASGARAWSPCRL